MTDRELGGFISTVEHPRPRDKFRRELRRALVATAASEWSSQPAAPKSRLSFPGFVAPRYVLAFAVLMLAVLSAGGVAAASSLPGDVTYALKMAYEQVELALASDDAARVEILARQADRRLDELNKVTASRPEQAPTASDAYRETVAKFEDAVLALKGAAPEDKESAALDVAVTAAEKHIAVLEAIKARNDSEEVDNALEQARDLEQTAKDKQKDDEERKHDGTPARQRPTPRPSPRTTATPRP
ncbi:MAG TPA: DUF5667 domain-containing protein [Candidatus Dormibacteraeota bacterium]|jgi:hypothetical protein|nr:DUF5667 domain-containing protein [Candidatus Dormibacteraeota bacterium]